jgi:hypothetical protein
MRDIATFRALAFAGQWRTATTAVIDSVPYGRACVVHATPSIHTVDTGSKLTRVRALDPLLEVR